MYVQSNWISINNSEQLLIHWSTRKMSRGRFTGLLHEPKTQRCSCCPVTSLNGRRSLNWIFNCSCCSIFHFPKRHIFFEDFASIDRALQIKLSKFIYHSSSFFHLFLFWGESVQTFGTRNLNAMKQFKLTLFEREAAWKLREIMSSTGWQFHLCLFTTERKRILRIKFDFFYTKSQKSMWLFSYFVSRLLSYCFVCLNDRRYSLTYLYYHRLIDLIDQRIAIHQITK